ncbi:MAG: hypothetical protein WC736_15350 [Gallionella sp.]|jgi:hypothetical protein
MLKKVIAVAAVLTVAACLSVFAGFDMYTSKNYTTILAPQRVADSSVAITNLPGNVKTVAGLVGKGAMLFTYSCENTAAATLAFSISSSATTNGSFMTYTNASGVSSWIYTNASGVAVIPFTPNSVGRCLRVTVTPTVVTNGVCGALLVTE